MFCPNCGAQIENDSHFCPKCGTKIEAAAPMTTPPPPAPEQAPAGAALTQDPGLPEGIFVTRAARTIGCTSWI